MARPPEFRALPAAIAALAPFGPYRGVIKRWVDGDTVEVWVDAGLHAYPYIAVRLADMSAAELDDPNPEQRQAARRAQLYADRAFPPGTPCAVHTIGRDAQSFGRFLGDLQLADGTHVSELLWQAGQVKRTLP